MRYPFDKYRTGTRYGQKGSLWKCGWHSGQDFLSANYGGDGIIYPIMHGVVEKVAHSASYGNYVMVRHPEGYVSLYAHMKTVYIKKGTVVTERTALGVEGATGNATGRHLHLEVHKGSYHYPADIDPLEFIKERLEVKKSIKIRLNGVEKTVTAIELAGNNYVRLQDLRDERMAIGYDAASKEPTVDAV